MGALVQAMERRWVANEVLVAGWVMAGPMAAAVVSLVVEMRLVAAVSGYTQ